MCPICRRPTQATPWGQWCDDCGGVAERLATGTRLFFRHVATVDGVGGRFPVVYDISAEQYGVAWPKDQIMVVCRHCGQRTPGGESRYGLNLLEDAPQQSNFYSARGTLDAMLALIQPRARGGAEDIPVISVAPTATVEEQKLVLGQ